MFLQRNGWMVFLLLFKNFIIYFFGGCAGSSLRLGLSLVAVSGGYCLAVVLGLLNVGASLVAGHSF